MSVYVDTFTEQGGRTIEVEPLTAGEFTALSAVLNRVVEFEDLPQHLQDRLEYALTGNPEAKFDEHEHPRDAHGRFAKKPEAGTVDVLDIIADVRGEQRQYGQVPGSSPAGHLPAKEVGLNYVPMAPDAWGTVPDALKPEAEALRAEYEAVLKQSGGMFDVDPSALHAAALKFGIASGLSLERDENRDIGEARPAAIYADGVVRRAVTERWQNRKKIAPEAKRDYLYALDWLRSEGKPMIATTPAALEGIFEDARFKTQFETGDSNGALNPAIRAGVEVAAFNHAPSMLPEKRTVYGYIATPATMNSYGVNQYGSVRWELKDDVRARTTMTMGDSMSTAAIPIPLDGEVSEQDKIRARSLRSGWFGGSDVADVIFAYEDPAFWLNDDYAEAQYHGGVSLDDVKAIHVDWDSQPWNHDDWVDEFAPYAEDIRDLGIRVFVGDTDVTDRVLRAGGVEAKFDPHQRRDSHGRWTDEGIATGLRSGDLVQLWPPPEPKTPPPPSRFAVPAKERGLAYAPTLPTDWPDYLAEAYRAQVYDNPDDDYYPPAALADAAERWSKELGLGEIGGGDRGLPDRLRLDPAAALVNGLLLRASAERAQRRKPLDTVLTKPEAVANYYATVDQLRAGKPMMAVTPETFVRLLTDEPRFKTQFETHKSGGALNPSGRAAQEVSAFNHEPEIRPEARVTYGYMATPGQETARGPAQYGKVRVEFKDEVRDRATMTIGDSLSTNAIPIPVTGPVTEEQKAQARATTGYRDVAYSAARSPEAFQRGDYAEAQYHGGLTIDDVKAIHIDSNEQPTWTHATWYAFLKPYAATLRAKGIEVFNEYGERLQIETWLEQG